MKMMKIVENKKIFFAISIIAVLISVISLLTLGLNRGIDFTSGTLFTLEVPAGVTASNIDDFISTSEVAADLNITSARVQGIGENQVSVRVPSLTPEEQNIFLDSLEGEFGEIHSLGIDQVDAIVGKELTKNAIISVILGCIGILIYVGFRFEFRFAVAGVLCLAQDVMVTIGLIVLLRQEVNSGFIVALLTIVGYSINNTIIIYDRLRENLKMGKYKDDKKLLVNTSISETLGRTINTAATTLVAIIALVVFGSASIRDLTLSMVIGIVAGTFSSVFLATPLWYVMSGGEKKAANFKK